MDYSEIADFLHPGKKTLYKSKYFSYTEEIPEMLKVSKMPEKDAVLMYGDKYDSVVELTSYKPVSNKSNDYFLKTKKRAGISNGRLENLGTWDVGPVSMNEFRWTLKKNGNKGVKFYETDKTVRITRGEDVRKIWEKATAKNKENAVRKLLKTGNKTSGCGGRKKRKTGNTSDDDLRKLIKSDNRRSASLKNLTKPPRGLPKMDSKPPSVPKSKSDSVFEMLYSKKGWW